MLTSNDVWYDNQVIGVNYLGKMMKNISKDAPLSVAYTNHCVRATCVTLLDAADYEARDIMAISGHRSESSIRSYSHTDMGKNVKCRQSYLLSAVKAQPLPKRCTRRTWSNVRQQHPGMSLTVACTGSRSKFIYYVRYRPKSTIINVVCWRFRQ